MQIRTNSGSVVNAREFSPFARSQGEFLDAADVYQPIKQWTTA
jgi:hypothetical protein